MRTEISAQAWRDLELILIKWGIGYETKFIEENETVRLYVDVEALSVKPESED